eukprot:m.12566 g.12566  ORF g.12566 m.12566 type:complete len:124 (-) comp4671_c0_seq1:1442-1813(-)
MAEHTINVGDGELKLEDLVIGSNTGDNLQPKLTSDSLTQQAPAEQQYAAPVQQTIRSRAGSGRNFSPKIIRRILKKDKGKGKESATKGDQDQLKELSFQTFVEFHEYLTPNIYKTSSFSNISS